jgi:hypothetical protein
MVCNVITEGLNQATFAKVVHRQFDCGDHSGSLGSGTDALKPRKIIFEVRTSHFSTLHSPEIPSCVYTSLKQSIKLTLP